MNLEHKTIKLKKVIKAPIDAVYKALSSTKEKAKWSAPGTDKIKYLKSNFKNGGIETFKCGPAGSLDFSGTLHYEDIIKNKRIVYTETVFYQKNKLSSALVSIELSEKNSSTLISMTIQVASYSGPQMLKGNEVGYKGSLNNLKQYLEETP
nr:SRPBCC domain-containing protein [Bacteriovorax sp. HI3]